MKLSKPSFRLQFIDGSPFVTVKKSGKTEESLLRGMIEIDEQSVGNNYHYYFAGFHLVVDKMDYHCSLFLTEICRLFKNPNFQVCIRAGGTVWTS